MHNWYYSLSEHHQKKIDYLWGLLPCWIKFGPRYIYNSLLLKKSQWYSRSRLQSRQLRQLKKLCIYSYHFIPYYRQIFDRCHFNPYHMSKLEDIEVLPFLDKNIIEQHFNDLISRKISSKKWTIQTTGGTTGRQLRFLTEKRTGAVREYPFVNSIWGRIGYQRQKSKVGVLRNQILPKGVLCEFDFKTRTWIFDTYHLTDENVGLILQKICELKLEFLHTYPSSVIILCEYIKKHHIIFKSNLKAILATSENIYPGQQEFIETMMKCRLFTFYGHSECACIAGWCEKSDLYHINTEYGYCELVDTCGKTIRETDKRGEIVCTGFGNYLMPLIRYKTGDYSSWASDQSCACGRNYPLLNQIEGRWTQEMFIGKDKNKISMTALNMHSDIFKNVENYQFIQDRIGKCTLRIMKAPAYTCTDEDAIRRELNQKFLDSIVVEFEYVSQIERTARGKQRFIIQNLKLS